jgi:hypothetical protein
MRIIPLSKTNSFLIKLFWKVTMRLKLRMVLGTLEATTEWTKVEVEDEDDEAGRRINPIEGDSRWFQLFLNVHSCFNCVRNTSQQEIPENIKN